MKRPRASTTGGGNNNGSTTAKRLKAPAKMNLLSLIMGHVSDHNFEDLWQAAFSIGTEVVSPIPPSDKVVITSVQRGKDEIIPMKTMKMSWVPYIPLENRLSQVERLKTQIFTLACTQRRSALKHLKIERVMQFNYCLPYIQSLEEDEDDDDTIVSIMFPLDLPIVTGFDWEMDDIEEFTDQLINNEELPEDKKDEFKEYLKGLVRDKKKAKRQEKEAKRKAIEDMAPETKAAYENMKFYKFYPVQTPDTPDISRVKEQRYINRYYGKAHVVM